jgi:hypothetical protein
MVYLWPNAITFPVSVIVDYSDNNVIIGMEAILVAVIEQLI